MSGTYHLFIDDSGSRYVDRPSTEQRRDGLDYFAMGGLLLPAEERAQTERTLASIRHRFGVTAPFHSSAMRSRKKAWSWLGRDEARASALMADLSSFLGGIPGYATACVIHRPGYQARYSQYSPAERWKLCKSAYAILIERSAKFASQNGRRLAVYVEQSGKTEDNLIRTYHAQLHSSGMVFNPETSGKYAPLKAPDFRNTVLQQPNFYTKDLLIGQVADLTLYPIVKGRYDPTYRPFCELVDARRLIDQSLDANDVTSLGIKYFCFDGL